MLLRKGKKSTQTGKHCGKAGSDEALDMVSAWVGEHYLVLEQVPTDEKSKERSFHNNRNASGSGPARHPWSSVTIYPMGCQTVIVKQIWEQQGDYMLAVKGNHPTLYQDIRDYVSILRKGRARSGLLTSGPVNWKKIMGG
jgi:hypothetical protein